MIVQPVAYDPATDIIEPCGPPSSTESAYLVEIVEPVTGWGDATHLVRVYETEYPNGWYGLVAMDADA